MKKKITDLEQDELFRKYEDKINKDIERMKETSKKHGNEMPKDVERQIRKQLLDLYIFQEEDKEREKREFGLQQKKLQKFLEKQAKNSEISQKNTQISNKNQNQIVYTVNQETTQKQQEIERKTYYEKSSWKSLSLKKRQENEEKNKGLCEMCLNEKATEVHHVVKFFNQDSESLRNKLLLDEENLVCLCSKCHHKVHGNWNKLYPYEYEWLQNKRNYLTDKYLKQGEIINVSDIVLR